MIKYGGTRNIDDANRVYELFRKARVLEPIPYALKGSVDAVVERQGQELKGVDFSKMIDNSLVDQLSRKNISKLFSDRRSATSSSADRLRRSESNRELSTSGNAAARRIP